MTKRYDMFCKVVDNFGDIGICWRLARQLQAEHGVQVRLFVDDLHVAAKIIPNLDLTASRQTIAQVEIVQWNTVQWDTETLFERFPDAVIEAFGCELPAAYLANMPAETAWVNLEYLTAENWIEGFHGRHSDFGATRHKRYFFYPGFTEKTGGLLRERSLLNDRPGSRIPLALQSTHLPNDMREALQISLFCYPHAPVCELLQQLSQAPKKSVVYVSVATLFPALQTFFRVENIQVSTIYTKGSLTVAVLPFLRQEDYDALLAICDLNFVRGEDSWVRAIWAGKPFIWQPYQQEEETHVAKLHAFLDSFYADCAQKDMLRKAHEYWLAGQGDAHIFQVCLQHLPAWETCVRQQSTTLAKQTDLASNLVIFIENLYKTRV